MRELILLLLFSLPTFANTAFDAGLQAYNQEKWSDAIAQWESITVGGQTSPELEYNLGNAYFRQGVIERSILHYERALKLNPNDDDARKNLALANRGIVDQIAHAPTLGIWKYTDNLRDSFSVSTLKMLLFLFNALLAIAVGAMFYTNGFLRDAARRGVILFGCLAGLMLFLYGWRSSALAESSAVVMAEKTDVFSSPTDNSTQLFSLHSGTKVHVGESLSEWTEIQLSDGRKGWIPRADIENI